MNRSRLLVFGALALTLGLAVSTYMYRYAQAIARVPSEPMIDVMVASNDLQLGARIETSDIRIVHVPLNVLPPNSPRKMVEVIGRAVVLPIPKGQFILLPELADENAGSGLPSLIPSDMRAISVRVNDVTSVAGFVTPGTRVDVFTTATRNGEAQTIRVLQNVAVLATGHTIERNRRGEAQGASVATLLVGISDAEKLILASNEGRIQLALRNPVDTRPGETDRGQTMRQLYSESEVTEPIRPRKRIAPVKPIPVRLPDQQEIQVYPGNGPVEVIKCQQGTCTQAK
jgi:pilus assembly protein CpaB